MRVLLCWGFCLLLAAEVVYDIRVDADAFVVELTPAAVSSAQVVVQMPATAPGTYQIHDWGRLVDDLEAVDAAGAALPLERLDTNTWRIDEAPRLARIRYRVRPSFSADLGDLPIYGMAGTNIERDNLLVNHFGICAYLRGQEDEVLRLRYLDLPAQWTLACALEPQRAGDDWILTARDYAELADSPLIAGELATATLVVDDTEILFAAYNVHGDHGQFQREWMRACFEPVVHATRDWLGGLPVDRYAFLLHARSDLLEIMGALEHRHSSLYLLPPVMPTVALRQIAAHEFFHIVTPLNLRSPLVDDFDFGAPVPPRHLWFYEGVTEYASHLILRHADLIDDAGFLGAMQLKFASTRAFDHALDLISLSEGSLHQHRDQYMDVYLRGALLGMALDLELLRLSAGQRGLRELILALLASYDPQRPFPADDFFEVIGAHSDPAIVPWLERHVAGAESPDYTALLAPAGVESWATSQGRYMRLLAQPSPKQRAFRRRWLQNQELP